MQNIYPGSMLRRSYGSTCMLIFIILTCLPSEAQEVPAEEGFVNVEGGRIWYKKVGDSEGIPLLMIHGGPGGTICGSIPYFSELADERPVIFYDQLESGCSDRPGDTSQWNIEHFVNEIDSLRKALQLDKLHIMGTSWGGSILAEYMATKDTSGVISVIFSSPLISSAVWIEDAKILLSRMPQNLQDTIAKYEAFEDYKAPAYLAASDSFYARYMSRGSGPYPSFPDCRKCSGYNDDIYNYMWGPTEFTVTGTLINFDRSADLPNITQPILFMTGRYDEARPESIQKFNALCQDARVAIIEDAGHATMYDQPKVVIKTVREFLREADILNSL